MDRLDARIASIELLYKEIFGRGADAAGLREYAQSSKSLEEIYTILYNSEEAKNRRKVVEQKVVSFSAEDKLPITLAMFVKNNEDSVALAIRSVLSVVKEVVVVDTGSEDNTLNICRKLGARIYKVGFTDFGSIRTLTAHLAREKYVFGLDSDEIILAEDLVKFSNVIEYMEKNNVDALGFPRKRWADLAMTKQEEPEVYPDFQYRFLRNKPSVIYERRVHERLANDVITYASEEFPCIQHFQSVFKNKSLLFVRNNLYKKLQKLDKAEGIHHSENAVELIDEVE